MQPDYEGEEAASCTARTTTRQQRAVRGKRPSEPRESGSQRVRAHPYAVEVDSVPGGGLNGHLNKRKVCLPPGEIIVQVQQQRAKAAAANELIEGFHVVGVQLEEAAGPVPCHLPGS